MDIPRTGDANGSGGPLQNRLEGGTKATPHDRRTLSDMEKPAGFMDDHDALQAHSMMRAAMDAMSCDPEDLQKAMEEERMPSRMKTKNRLDIRLVITMVGLLFLILVIDLLLQVL